MEYLFIIVPAFILFGFVFTFMMIFSPKLRGKMMARQIKATKHMLDASEDDLRNMATRAAKISKESVEITSKAVKDGFTSDGFSSSGLNYCRHCSEPIDADSNYCKRCGKRVN